MKQRPPDMPDYNRPPIDEVAISVQFPPIDDFAETNIREYWREEVQQDYPIAERQPRLEGPIESPDPAPTASVLQVPIGIVPQGRMWLISESDDFLIQIQNTRFIQNWRRRKAAYEHFDQIHELFGKTSDGFESILTVKVCGSLGCSR